MVSFVSFIHKILIGLSIIGCIGIFVLLFEFHRVHLPSNDEVLGQVVATNQQHQHTNNAQQQQAILPPPPPNPRKSFKKQQQPDDESSPIKTTNAAINNTQQQLQPSPPNLNSTSIQSLAGELSSNNKKRKDEPIKETTKFPKDLLPQIGVNKFLDDLLELKDDNKATNSIATTTKDHPRIYCVIPFIWTPKSIARYKEIVQTWGKRCDVLRFMIDPIVGSYERGYYNASILPKESLLPNVRIVNDMTRPWNDCGDTVGGNEVLKIVEEKPCRHLWEKMWRTWVWISQNNELSKGDWFVKLDWDTYFFPDNLRQYIQDNNWSPEEYHFAGHTIYNHFKSHNTSVMVGAVEILSHATIRDITIQFPKMKSVTTKHHNSFDCIDRPGQQEDVTMTVCLKEHLGVEPEGLRLLNNDNKGCDIISPFTFPAHLMGNRTANLNAKGEDTGWFWIGKPKEWEFCLSTKPIGFHMLKLPSQLYGYENLFYSTGPLINEKLKLWQNLNQKQKDYVIKVRDNLHRQQQQ